MKHSYMRVPYGTFNIKLFLMKQINVPYGTNISVPYETLFLMERRTKRCAEKS